MLSGLSLSVSYDQYERVKIPLFISLGASLKITASGIKSLNVMVYASDDFVNDETGDKCVHGNFMPNDRKKNAVTAEKYYLGRRGRFSATNSILQ